MRKYLSHLASALIVMMLSYIGCSSSDPVAAVNVSLTPVFLALELGQTKQVEVWVAPDNARNREFDYAVIPEGVVSVTRSGNILSVKGESANNAVITVTTRDNQKTAECRVTVSIPVEDIVLVSDTIELGVNQTKTIGATVVPHDATNPELRFEISGTNSGSVGIVNASTGEIVGLAPGVAVVRIASAENGAIAKTCTVTVRMVPVTGLNLVTNELQMEVDETKTIEANVLPTNATNQALKYEISGIDTGVIQIVDASSGLIKGLKNGSAAVKVSSLENVSIFGTCFVRVGTPIPPHNVYVAGHQGSQAIRWTNGEAKNLGSGGALSISVIGSDVYVGGSRDGYPTFWKNNDEPVVQSSWAIALSAFTVSQLGDTYFTGTNRENWVYRPAVWKNSEAPKHLSPGGYGRGIFTVGSDVYVTGYDERACLWKYNGSSDGAVTETRLASDGVSYGYSVYVANGVAYVVGRANPQSYPIYLPTATYWKVGSSAEGPFHINVYPNQSEALSAFVSGNDLYMAGYVRQGGTSGIDVATVWKIDSAGNVTTMTLTDGTYQAQARSVYVLDGVVYVAGYRSNGTAENAMRIATVWRDGVVYPIDVNEQSASEAVSIFVTRAAN
jgi:uncharacterized protein YjdB